jgi:hypothetical protein
MESASALIISLTSQESALAQAHSQINQLKLRSNEMYQALLFAVSAAKLSANEITGGSALDARAILQKVNKKNVRSSVLEALYEVEGAYPYIRANIDLCGEACESAIKHAAVARKLSAPLVMQLHAAQASNSFSHVDRTGLSAFNSDMAQLDTRVNALGCITNDLMHDMGDALQIFQSLEQTCKNPRLNLSRGLIQSLDSLKQSSASVANMVTDLVDQVRKCMGSPLLHPTLLVAPAVPSALSQLQTILHSKS